MNAFKMSVIMLAVTMLQGAGVVAYADNALIDREVYLKNKAEVWSKSVCLHDIVDGGWVNSRCAVDRQICCRWSLGEATARTFTKEAIQREIANIKIAGFGLELKGADSVKVVQTRRELSTAEIEAKFNSAVMAKFGSEKTRVSAESIRLMGAVYVGLEQADQWDVILPENLTKQMPVKIVSTREPSQVIGWAQIKPRLESEVYVAKKIVRPNQTLSPSDFELKKADILGLHISGQAVFRKDEFPAAVRARQSIHQGAVLTSVVIERIPTVRFGDVVTLLLRSDNLKISTKGVVQSTAGVGDMVTVQLPRYNRTFRGRLVQGKLVEVWL